ncbi:MAG: ComEC/Rec2 family competence protein [Lentisphaeria bacterium]|nr:ComEC/Rec2 family competence protein [Lentisphaeria bacterium]
MRKFIEKIPFEFVLLTFIVSGALTVMTSTRFYTALLWLIPCAAMAWKVNFFKGLFAALGIILLTFSVFIRSQESKNSLKEQLNNRPVYGRILFEINDPLCCSLPDISHSATIQIKIHQFTDITGTVYSGTGKFLIYSKDTIPATASYGDIFEVYGTLRFPDSASVWNIDGNSADFDFRFGNFQRFMHTHGIDGIISVDRDSKIIEKSANDSFFRRILLCRDRILQYVTSTLSKENKALVGAMFFGIKGAIDSESKQDYIRSGTIHLFSVSGLHIGILFAVILPLLAWIPVRWRYLCATILLIPFLLTTGMAIPAVRAFLIILFFSLLRCSCFMIPPLRLLALGCSIFLIWQYKYLYDAGFLYSFGITAILLMVSENTVKWNKIWNTNNTLKASNRRNPLKYSRLPFFIRKIVFALSATLAAFAFGSIITLFSFGYLYLSGIWVNFFIIFYCPVLIYLFIIRTILAPFDFCGGIFDGSLSFMQKVIKIGADYPMQLNTVQIPIYAAIIFYIVLISIMYVRNKKYFVCGTLFILFFFPVSSMLGKLQKNALLIIRDNTSNETAFVLAEPQSSFAWCFNIQNTQSIELARKFLGAKGINHINIWMFHGSSKNKLNALVNGAKNLKILKIIHIARSDMPFKSDFLSSSIYERHNQKLNDWEITENQIRFFRKKTLSGFEYFNPQAIIPLYVKFDSEKQLLSFAENDKIKTEKLANSNILEYSVYEL